MTLRSLRSIVATLGAALAAALAPTPALPCTRVLYTAPDGMNEKGLVANLLYLAEPRCGKPDGRPALSISLRAQYALDNFATEDSPILEYVGGKLHAGEVSASFVPAKPFTFLPVKLDGSATDGGSGLRAPAPPCYTVAAPLPGGVR